VNAIEPSEAPGEDRPDAPEGRVELMPAEYCHDGAVRHARSSPRCSRPPRRSAPSRADRTSHDDRHAHQPGGARIKAVTRAGVMDAFPNHTFQPNATVRRGDPASPPAVLTLIAAEKPKLAMTARRAPEALGSRPRI
jgi:hypothetical protein